MLQMRQSMPNNLSCLRKYQVHPIHLSQMWVDCYPSEDTDEGETMNKCPAYLCADSDICLLPKYHALIAQIKEEEE